MLVSMPSDGDRLFKTIPAP